MDLIDHFSCYTHLPVKLADIAQHVIDTSSLDFLVRYPVDVDPSILRGVYRSYSHKPPYAPAPWVVGEVIYSKHLDPFEARLVQCKEMLHAFDKESHMASKIEQVRQLAADIVLPVEALFRLRGLPSHQWWSDNGTLFTAIAVLLPRDFLNEIRPLHDEGRVTAAQIAQAARIPEEYVRLALRDDWGEILDTVTEVS